MANQRRIKKREIKIKHQQRRTLRSYYVLKGYELIYQLDAIFIV